MAITASTTSVDREKFLASKLISRLHSKLVAASLCTKVEQPKGSGKTAYFVRYNRMNVPVTTITEGTDPSASSFSLTEFTVELDQWGDIIEITDVAELTTKHPLVKQAMELLAENAQRVIDREIQIVWMAATNVQYGVGSATARASLASTDILKDTVIHKALVTLKDAGVSPKGGPTGGNQVQVASAQGMLNAGRAYVAVAGPHVLHDLMGGGLGTATTSFVAVAQYSNAKALYNSEVGTWLGVRFVETNFIPKFSRLGNTTAAVASTGTGGITGFVITSVNHASGALSNATTYYWKVTRKDLQRGFEEAISIEHSTATGAGDDAFTFALPSTAGYVYNVYFGDATGNANLKLAAENQAASATVTVLSVPASTTTAPANIPDALTNVHPIFVHGEDSCMWVGLQKLEVKVTKPGSIVGNVLELKRAIGFKFMGKCIVPDSNKLLRIEVTSAF